MAFGIRFKRMQFEAFSHPKARDLSVLADDIFLHIPGCITAVFDGATDATGRKIDGVSVGRLAALAAARATASLPHGARDWPAQRILTFLSDAIARDVPNQSGTAPASTTAMVAFERPDTIRMVGIGDTGYRVNGGPVQITELAPDFASIPARVALFQHLLSQDIDTEKSEKISRHYMGLGLDMAVRDDVIPADICNAIIVHAVNASQAPDAPTQIEAFLRSGLQNQYRYSNSDHPLGYGVLNGYAPNRNFIIDQNLPRDTLKTLEVFSDGYLLAPETVSLQAWEQTHQQLELDDPHKTNLVLACKGSTKSSFFDDRTIVILKFL